MGLAIVAQINAMPAGRARLAAALDAQSKGMIPENFLVLDDGSIVDGAASLTEDADVAAAAGAIEQRILDRPWAASQSGTVQNVEGQGYGFGKTVANVRIDGDPGDVITQCGVMIPGSLGPGDRVLVQFQPPFAHVVVGSLDGAKTPACRISWVDEGGG